MKRGARWLVLAVAAVLAWPTASLAEGYVLGTEDVVAISVYLHPELDRNIAIDADGNITFAPIGAIKAAGQTPKQLGDKISERLATYLRQTTSVSVTVSQYFNRSVFVQGAVARPGRYGFERIPGLVEVIGTAGGAAVGADLSRVEIVRRDGAGRRTVYANVAAALRDGNTTAIPELMPGDIVTVPGGLGSGAGVPGEGVGVLGEVARPGVYPVGAGQDLWSVLAVAGGTTARGDLSNVRVLTRTGASQAVVTFDLKETLKRGSLRPQIVKPGDVVYVAPSGASKLATAFGGFQTVLAISRDLLNLALLRTLINDQNKP